MNGYLSRLSTAGLALADVVVLVRCDPDWQALSSRLSAPRAWVDRAGADAAAITVASALLWCAAIWLAFGLLAAATSVLPGRIGRLGATVSHRVMPAALRRVVIGAAGVSLVLSPASAVAEGIASPSASATVTATTPAVGWPIDQNAAPSPAPGTQQSGPTINWPSITPPPSGTAPRTSAPRPPSAPPLSTTQPPRHAAPTAGADVTVRPGDSLWLIAAHRLGPKNVSDDRIAAEWPRWYSANHGAIGNNPDLLMPGQHLSAPAAVNSSPKD
jgi:hypothetical protein